MGVAKRHAHKYYKAKLSFGDVWACALPDCNHYMPTHMAQMVPGKNTLCWKCDNVTTMTLENMKSDKPLCPECSGEADLAAFINQRLREGNSQL